MLKPKGVLVDLKGSFRKKVKDLELLEPVKMHATQARWARRETHRSAPMPSSVPIVPLR
jgi:hypothetical protein